MSKFCPTHRIEVTIRKVIDVQLPEDCTTLRFLEEFRRSIFPVESVEEVAEYVAWAAAQELNFCEGVGPLHSCHDPDDNVCRYRLINEEVSYAHEYLPEE